MEYVYLIWQNGTSLYKIGKANNPSDRLKRLQTGHSGKLFLIAQMECEDAFRKEAYLHMKYEECRANGEWFNIPPTLLHEVFAEFNCHVSATPDTPLYYWASVAQAWQTSALSMGETVVALGAELLEAFPVSDLQREITHKFLMRLVDEIPAEIIAPRLSGYSCELAEMRLIAEQVGFAGSYKFSLR